MTQTLETLYSQFTGHAPESMEALPGAGSNRSYYRLKGTPTLIGVCGTSREENEAFIYLSRHFQAQHLPVPAVHAVSNDGLCYLQDDLGTDSLFQLIAHGRETGEFGSTEKDLLKKVIRLLPRIQFEGAQGLDFGKCYPAVEFNHRSILWDLNYFKYCFLKATGVEFREDLLEDDFETLCQTLIESMEPQPVFMYRDFQSRNIMVKDGEPYLIDFQGGRKGPLYYDVASFLWQAKANYPDSLRQELIDEYLEALRPYKQIEKEVFLSRLRHVVLFRTLQVLGAYGFRGYFEKKTHFIESIPFAIENLRQLLQEGFPEYPYLCEVLQRMTELKQFAAARNRRNLTVTVMSFSYRKGIPADESGNGGGYVFDCRAVHNPGRYEQYKSLTGLNTPVIEFLEKDGEITEFLRHTDALVDAHVQRFLERGFSHLMICFGCTGGQHRSVYSAQHTAVHLHEKCTLDSSGTTNRPITESQMKAMIFAAGLGTRLKPLTDHMPKALVPVAGRPMLEHVILKLKEAGFTELVINIHHFGEQIIDFLKANQNFGLTIHISDERDRLLDTGGGIKKAATFFTGTEPFLVHNVDILSNADLKEVYDFHRKSQNLATLLVSPRKTSRYLLFDTDNRLQGWIHKDTLQTKPEGFVYEPGQYREYAFSGIHVISPELFHYMDGEAWKGKFPIMDFYLHTCRQLQLGGCIKEDLQLIDIGKPDTLARAEEFLKD